MTAQDLYANSLQPILSVLPGRRSFFFVPFSFSFFFIFYFLLSFTLVTNQVTRVNLPIILFTILKSVSFLATLSPHRLTDKKEFLSEVHLIHYV